MMLKFDEEGNILRARSIKPFVSLDVKESPKGYIIGVGGDYGVAWPGYNFIEGLILKMDIYNGIRGACDSKTYYFNEVYGEISYKDFEIKIIDFDKSKILKASNYEIDKYSYYSDSEYLCYTGCIRVAVCTEDFPPQCTIEKKCNE